MKTGDVVANIDQRTGRCRHAYIARGKGDPDKHVLLLYLDGSFAQDYPYNPHCYSVGEERDGRVLITKEDSDFFLQQIIPRLDRLMDERNDRERSAGIRTIIDEMGRKKEISEGTDDLYHGPLPSSRGHGGALSTQEPIRLAEYDRPARWSKQFYRFLIREEDVYERAVFDLSIRNTLWYEAYVRHAHDEEKLVDIAKQLGVSSEAIYKRWQRGKSFIKNRREVYQQDEDADAS